MSIDVEKFIAGLHEYLERAFKPIFKRIKNLERSIAAMQKKSAFPYKGIFRDDAEYQQGEFVTHKGSLWHCLESTTTRPGNGSHWVLVVKSGER